MKSIFFLLVMMTYSGLSFSATPSCNQNGSDPYCSYNGTIERLYINASNVMLIYFESAMDPSVAQNVGFSVTSGNAAALKITESNSDFFQLLYSTALAAKMAGSTVSMQMRGNESGYMKVDRIWLK